MRELKRETDRKVLGVFRPLLDLPKPWRMLAVEINEEKKLLGIEMELLEAVRVVFPECHRACGIYDHQGMRRRRHLDTMGHTTRLWCRVPRSECPAHWVKMATWAAAGSRFAMEFDEASVRLLLFAQNQSAAAGHLGLNWHQVHRIRAAAVGRGLQRRGTEQMRRVGRDEESVGRGHHYGTVLTDLDHMRVLELVEHREQASLGKALDSLPAEQVVSDSLCAGVGFV